MVSWISQYINEMTLWLQLIFLISGVVAPVVAKTCISIVESTRLISYVLHARTAITGK